MITIMIMLVIMDQSINDVENVTEIWDEEEDGEEMNEDDEENNFDKVEENFDLRVRMIMRRLIGEFPSVSISCHKVVIVIVFVIVFVIVIFITDVIVGLNFPHLTMRRLIGGFPSVSISCQNKPASFIIIIIIIIDIIIIITIIITIIIIMRRISLSIN